MNYLQTKQYAHDHKCPDCHGLGKQNDCEPGDTFFNQWECPSCKGTGWKNGQEALIPNTEVF